MSRLLFRDVRNADEHIKNINDTKERMQAFAESFVRFDDQKQVTDYYTDHERAWISARHAQLKVLVQTWSNTRKEVDESWMLPPLEDLVYHIATHMIDPHNSDAGIVTKTLCSTWCMAEPTFPERTIPVQRNIVRAKTVRNLLHKMNIHAREIISELLSLNISTCESSRPFCAFVVGLQYLLVTACLRNIDAEAIRYQLGVRFATHTLKITLLPPVFCRELYSFAPPESNTKKLLLVQQEQEKREKKEKKSEKLSSILTTRLSQRTRQKTSIDSMNSINASSGSSNSSASSGGSGNRSGGNHGISSRT